MLDIKLINYKFYADNQIIYESNGKVKEYNLYFDKLKFEGEYLNGKRNGKGKEYDFEGNLVNEGEFKNGLFIPEDWEEDEEEEGKKNNY